MEGQKLRNKTMYNILPPMPSRLKTIFYASFTVILINVFSSTPLAVQKMVELAHSVKLSIKQGSIRFESKNFKLIIIYTDQTQNKGFCIVCDL